MVFEWLGAYDCSSSFALRALSTCLCVKPTCLRADLENSNIGSANKSPFQKETRRGIKRSCLFTNQSSTKASPFPSLRAHSKHEGTNMKCKPNCVPGGTLSKTRPAGEPLWRDTRRDPLAGGILGGIHWRAGILGGIHWRATLGGIHWRAALVEYSAGSTGEPLWRDTRRARPLWRDTGRDPLTRNSGRILGGIYWPAALAGYSAGSTGEPLWRDTWRDPLASRSGGILDGIHWRATPLTSRFGGILGGIHWPAALAGYSAGSGIH